MTGTGPNEGMQTREDEEKIDREDPDVFLDVPKVQVDTITLQVENLRAKVSLQVEVLDMVQLSVGADVDLGQVDLRLEGVEAQASLKVHLKNVREIVQEVLRTVDNNPELVRKLGATVEDTATVTASGVGETVARSAEQLGPSGANPAIEADSKVEQAGTPPWRTGRARDRPVCASRRQGHEKGRQQDSLQDRIAFSGPPSRTPDWPFVTSTYVPGVRARPRSGPWRSRPSRDRAAVTQRRTGFVAEKAARWPGWRPAAE